MAPLLQNRLIGDELDAMTFSLEGDVYRHVRALPCQYQSGGMSFWLRCESSSLALANLLVNYSFFAAAARAALACETTAPFLTLVPSTIVMFRPSCFGANSTKATSDNSSARRINNL